MRCVGDRAFHMFAFLRLKYHDKFMPRCQTPADGDDADVDADDVEGVHAHAQVEALLAAELHERLVGGNARTA
jgi:hypothetical protein